MSRRISARLREEAAVACAQNATQMSDEVYPWECSAAAQELSWSALFYVNHSDDAHELSQTEMWAEAEALLRTGWSP